MREGKKTQGGAVLGKFIRSKKGEGGREGEGGGV